MGKLPSNTLEINDFETFRTKVRQWTEGKYNQYLVMLGDPGLGKSEVIRREMMAVHGPEDQKWGYVKSQTTAFSLYELGYRYQLLPLVFDDVDGMLSDRKSVSVLKAICDTALVRKVAWHSNHKKITNGELPRSYKTISQVAILTNAWDAWSQNLNALYNRALVLYFNPSALEVHREVGLSDWFKDQEVWDLIGANLNLITRPSFRFYNTALGHKKASNNWKQETLATLTFDIGRGEAPATKKKLIAVAGLLTNRRYKGDKEAAAKAFEVAGHGSRATFFRYQLKLAETVGAFEPEEVNNLVWDSEAKMPKPPSAYDLKMQQDRERLELERQKLLDAGGVRDEDEEEEEEDEEEGSDE